MPTQTATLTHCPTCGVKLERPELSLCAYCASPLRVGPVEVPNDETQKRLAKVKAHADFPAALRWLPVDPVFESRAHARATWGVVLVLAALTVALAGYGLAGRPAALGFATAADGCATAAIVLALGGATLLALASAARAAHRRQPMLKRAAYVLDRSSRTSERGGIGATTYFFKIRFEDGSEGEFSHVGRGSMYEPPAIGAAGVAYTRGTRMIEFRRI